MLKVIGSRSKVAPGCDHETVQLDHGRNICAQFELFPVYGQRDQARTMFYITFRRILCLRSKSQGQRLNPGLIMTLHN